MRRLKSSRGRRRSQQLLLEGPHLVGVALEGGCQLGDVLATTDFEQSHRSLLEELGVADRVQLVEDRLLEELADADSPRGLIAAATVPEPSAHDVVAAVKRRRSREHETGTAHRTWVVVDGIQDPGNLGAIARSVEASGGLGLFLVGDSVSWRHPRALRASAGSLLRLPCSTSGTLPELDSAFAAAAIRPLWVALETQSGVDLWSWKPESGNGDMDDDTDRDGDRDSDSDSDIVLCLGSEAHGISETLSQRCGLSISIPTAQVESLNAAVAVSVVLFELDRRRRRRKTRTPAAL